jgi:hypothetical protein
MNANARCRHTPVLERAKSKYTLRRGDAGASDSEKLRK